ncbi:MAG: flagellar basal body-associated FliL family protein [Betaproteobacteria bacterium]|nr:flagellar basal body-associated FliL family protein [Betaproteobacteria bacterium]
MATAEETEVEEKPKKPILKILLLVLVVLLLIGGTVGATLFFSGFFSKKAVASAEQELEGAEAAAKEGDAAAGKDGKAAQDAKAAKPDRVKKNTPELVRFEYTYKQMEKELLSNLTGTRKVMQIQIAFMTSYDERVFQNVEKHEFAVRGALLDVMRQYTEADVNRPEFRKELAEKLKDEANRVLTQYEDFGGIDAVHFTSFIVQ